MIDSLLRGKMSVDEICEDLLTSTAFGVLKHLPVQKVWLPILQLAKEAKVEERRSFRAAFEAVAAQVGVNVSDYNHVRVSFWPQHEQLGEPDVLVTLFGDDALAPPLAFLIEVKLWSRKGTWKEDQLCRYLRAIRDLRFLDPAIPAGALPIGLIYLTALESSQEVEHSRANWGDGGEPFRCYQLAWQDVADLLRRISADLLPPFKSMTSELAEFLGELGLVRFNKYTKPELPAMTGSWGCASRHSDRTFFGFTADWTDMDPEPRSFYKSATPNEIERA